MCADVVGDHTRCQIADTQGRRDEGQFGLVDYRHLSVIEHFGAAFVCTRHAGVGCSESAIVTIAHDAVPVEHETVAWLRGLDTGRPHVQGRDMHGHSPRA